MTLIWNSRSTFHWLRDCRLTKLDTVIMYSTYCAHVDFTFTWLCLKVVWKATQATKKCIVLNLYLEKQRIGTLFMLWCTAYCSESFRSYYESITGLTKLKYYIIVRIFVHAIVNNFYFFLHHQGQSFMPNMFLRKAREL